MPLQNRVTPLGDLISDPARGLLYGNRGCLHDGDGTIRRSFAVKRWIACRLEFKGRKRRLLRPGRYTELFFLDEATAFSAGHRPCAECRREDYNRFVEVVGLRAAAIDERLHCERLDASGARRLYRANVEDVPDGAFLLDDGEPWLVLGAELLRWTPAGYTERARRRPKGDVEMITPPLLVDVLRSGWRGSEPLLHPSAAPERV